MDLIGCEMELARLKGGTSWPLSLPPLSVETRYLLTSTQRKPDLLPLNGDSGKLEEMYLGRQIKY